MLWLVTRTLAPLMIEPFASFTVPRIVGREILCACGRGGSKGEEEDEHQKANHEPTAALSSGCPGRNRHEDDHRHAETVERGMNGMRGSKMRSDGFLDRSAEGQ